jgi:S1-C subfamily serine protease
VAVDGFEVADARAAFYRLTTRGIGNSARLDVLRNGRSQSMTVKLAEPPRGGSEDVRNLSGRHPFDGARVSNILPGIADELRLDEDEGVVVLSVRNGSTAARLGLRPGDIILQIGRSRIASVQDLDRAVKSPQRVWQMAIKRGGRVLQVEVQG